MFNVLRVPGLRNIYLLPRYVCSRACLISYVEGKTGEDITNEIETFTDDQLRVGTEPVDPMCLVRRPMYWQAPLAHTGVQPKTTGFQPKTTGAAFLHRSVLLLSPHADGCVCYSELEQNIDRSTASFARAIRRAQP